MYAENTATYLGIQDIIQVFVSSFTCYVTH